MTFLITNDDGVDAPGLQALVEAARPLGDVVVAAPVSALSGCSHRVTTDHPLRVFRRPDGQYALDGTPADCVRVGLHRLAPEATWVLSGINAGGNLGADIHHSGTVAAVREGVLHGRPGVAFSHYRKRNLTIDWQWAATWAQEVLRDLLVQPWHAGIFWNVNLPHLEPGSPPPRVIQCRLEPGPLPLSFREDGELLHYNGDYHQRRRGQGNDVDVCFGGHIAVTRIALF